MISLQLPAPPALSLFLQEQALLPYTYPRPEITRSGEDLPGYQRDHARVLLGRGEAVWERAWAALLAWQMFPPGWTRVLPAGQSPEAGTVVAVCIRFAGLWWRNSARVVYRSEGPQRRGFAYGTLPGHVEAGEELFLLTRDSSGDVYYEIHACSRPRHWITWAGYPLIRLLQARFRRDSCRAMQALTRTAI